MFVQVSPKSIRDIRHPRVYLSSAETQRFVGPVYTPLQPASRSAENMENWTLGATPLHGRASQPAEMGPTYGELTCPVQLHIRGPSAIGETEEPLLMTSPIRSLPRQRGF